MAVPALQETGRSTTEIPDSEDESMSTSPESVLEKQIAEPADPDEVNALPPEYALAISPRAESHKNLPLGIALIERDLPSDAKTTNSQPNDLSAQQKDETMLGDGHSEICSLATASTLSILSPSSPIFEESTETVSTSLGNETHASATGSPKGADLAKKVTIIDSQHSHSPLQPAIEAEVEPNETTAQGGSSLKTDADAIPTSSKAEASKTKLSRPSPETTLAELKAQKATLIESFANLPVARSLLREKNILPAAPMELEAVASEEIAVLAAAKSLVDQHIKLLHEYNEIKDIGQGLMGLIADQRGVRIADVQDEFGIGTKD